jgi:mRNA interferase HigB
MHVISRRPFLEATKRYPNSRAAIEDCYRVLKNGTFENPEALRQVFPSLDNFEYRDRWWVIDISGNHLRLMAFIEFKHNRVYVRHIVTHAEYNKLTEKYRQEGKR